MRAGCIATPTEAMERRAGRIDAAPVPRRCRGENRRGRGANRGVLPTPPPRRPMFNFPDFSPAPLSSASSDELDAGSSPARGTGGACSPVGRDWLSALAGPEAWACSDAPDDHAEFFLDIVTLLQQTPAFPPDAHLSVTWAFLDRHKPATVASRELPGDAGAGPIGRSDPWLCGYFLYDGSAHVGLGWRIASDAGEERGLRHIQPLQASAVFDLAAQAFRECHRGARLAAPSDCQTGLALRQGLIDHLRGQPKLADRLANRYVLGSTFRPPRLPEGTEALNRRATLSQLGSRAEPVDYRVPVEVMRVLAADPELREFALSGDQPAHVARRLGISPTALRASFVRERSKRPLSVLGAQSLRPELIKRPCNESRAPSSDPRARGVQWAYDLFDSGTDIAEALSRRVVNIDAVGRAVWIQDNSEG